MLAPSLPPRLQGDLDSWGARMVRDARLQLARSGVCRAGVVGGVSPTTPLRLGTDCAGADAPVWALRQLGLPFTHAFASDSWSVARRVLSANSSPGVLYEDMCDRQDVPLPPHDLYVCGFPCQPFSTLHHKTKLLREAKAKPFRAMLTTIRNARPVVAVLENVPGIMRVFTTLRKCLLGLKDYHIVYAKLDPRMFGDPVARPRLYIILARKDLCVCEDAVVADKHMSAMLDVLRSPVRLSAHERMLPSHHHLVHRALQRGRGARRQTEPRSASSSSVITPTAPGRSRAGSAAIGRTQKARARPGADVHGRGSVDNFGSSMSLPAEPVVIGRRVSQAIAHASPAPVAAIGRAPQALARAPAAGVAVIGRAPQAPRAGFAVSRRVPQAPARAPAAGVALSGPAPQAFGLAPVAGITAIGRGAKIRGDPVRIGRAPRTPLDLGQKPPVIGRCASLPRTVGRGVSRPVTPGRGASRPSTVGRGLSCPPTVGRGVTRPVGILSAPARPELSVREAAGLSEAKRAEPSLYACDVSQSKARMPTTTDGTLPTLTPNGKVFVVPLGRCVSGVEKLLLHGFPLHRMQLPADLSERNLNLLGGNTMHVKCIAAALLLGCSMVTFGNLSDRGVSLPKTYEVECGEWRTRRSEHAGRKRGSPPAEASPKRHRVH